tara:strand:+ start:43 stop:864 length:822 start_codon:yes stop_codon:yes gene_type:complete
MSNLSMFCITLNPGHEEIIKNLSYIPVGLGEKKFSDDCFSDKAGLNISNKNTYYGEYTFHYWLWKNYLNKIKTDWVGFCQYRKFFIKDDMKEMNLNFDIFKRLLIKNIDILDEKFDCLLGNKFSVQNYKFSKIVKNHLKEFLKNPSLIFNKEKRNLKFHFDLFHGKGNLELAIDQLDNKNKYEFKKYMNENTEFHPHNMFICKKNILSNYYEIIFPWLEKCENIFGFENLNEYGNRRIYGFLAERFLSFWFQKNYNIKEVNILGKDLTDYKNL